MKKLADLIGERLVGTKKVKEKEMVGGLTFMINNKMCVGIINDEMMCRIEPAKQEDALAKTGCRVMDFSKRPMKGYVMVNHLGIKTEKDLSNWIALCLEFNKKAKSSKKK